jgi:hypothetical protein
VVANIQRKTWNEERENEGNCLVAKQTVKLEKKNEQCAVKAVPISLLSK